MQTITDEQLQLVSFGKYNLTGITLGKGNYSSVREGIDTTRNMRIALKIIDLVNARDNYVKRNYKREALILAKLKHPNIVILHEVLESSKHFVLVLELIPENLCDYVRTSKRGKLEEYLARLFFRQLASAISFIHEQGIIHRDIKLENILIERLRQRVKITDFGLSNNWDKNSLLTTNCGSPEYSAPELHAGRPYDCAVDVWSLGVVLFAMVVGRLPFDVERKKPVNNQHRRELFLDETSRGIKTMKHQAFIGGTSYFFKELTSQMLNPDEHKRIKMHDVEHHNWLVFKRIDNERMSNTGNRSQNTTSTTTSKANKTNYNNHNGVNKSSNFLAHRPNTATTTTRRSPPSTCNIPKLNVLPRPTTQASQFRLRPTTINGYLERLSKLKTDKS